MEQTPPVESSLYVSAPYPEPQQRNKKIQIKASKQRKKSPQKLEGLARLHARQADTEKASQTKEHRRKKTERKKKRLNKVSIGIRCVPFFPALRLLSFSLAHKYFLEGAHWYLIVRISSALYTRKSRAR
jgi:hypothetical protein